MPWCRCVTCSSRCRVQLKRPFNTYAYLHHWFWGCSVSSASASRIQSWYYSIDSNLLTSAVTLCHRTRSHVEFVVLYERKKVALFLQIHQTESSDLSVSLQTSHHDSLWQNAPTRASVLMCMIPVLLILIPHVGLFTCVVLLICEQCPHIAVRHLFEPFS